MRLIDADKLEPHEIYDDNGFTEVVYMDDIREMPTVDVEPIRHGHWIEVSPQESYKCSVCSFITDWEDIYCPNCGAKMDEEIEDEID